jgi:zinc transport system ATP-binding protein
MLISVDNVSVSYEGKKAVDGVSFAVEKGDCLCVVGENGSGKTTLIKTVVGLQKRDSGTVSFYGLNRSEIGYLPQQTAEQKDFPASVFEVVLSGRLNRHGGVFAFYNAIDRKIAADNLERLGIARLKKRSFRELSGGERQRALLARALCATDKLLILDEPVTGLDPVMTAEMYAILEKLNAEGITIVMISHDMDGAVRYGNKILHMARSAIFFGTVEEYTATELYAGINARRRLGDLAV